MTILHWIKVYFSIALVFFALDMLWLGVIAKGFYRQQLGSLLLDEFNWIAAFCFYAFFLLGILYFVIASLPLDSSLIQVILRSVFFGIITYATYDLTNLATLKNWPLFLCLVDIAWGGFLSGLVGTIGFYIHRYFQFG